MFKSIQYVIKENLTNLYRIYLIAKYEILADSRDSKLGLLWNILNPLIQIGTYWFVFGIGLRSGKPVDGIPFLLWMVTGMTVWFYISPSITGGVSSIYTKANIITKMKFPVSILPTTIVTKELFNHTFMLGILFVVLMIGGISPSVYNFMIIYYIICATAFGISLAMVTSVLNMFTRDVKKMVNASMRMLLYITPILWNMKDNLPIWIQNIMKLNPINYIVEGYRNSLLFHKVSSIEETLIFWVIIFILFGTGSVLMNKHKHKFIDLI